MKRKYLAYAISTLLISQSALSQDVSETKYQKLTQKYKVLEKEHRDLKYELARQEKTLEAKDLERWEKENQKLEYELSRAKKILTHKTEQIEKVNTQIKLQNEKINTLEKALYECKIDQNNLQSTPKNEEDTLAMLRLKEENMALTTRVEELKKSYRNKTQELAEADQRGSVYVDEITRLKVEKQALKKSIGEMEVETQNQEGQIDNKGSGPMDPKKELLSSKVQLNETESKLVKLSAFVVNDMNKEVNQVIRISDPKDGAKRTGELLNRIKNMPFALQPKMEQHKIKLLNYQNYYQVILEVKRTLAVRYSFSRNNDALTDLRAIRAGLLIKPHQKILEEHIRLLENHCLKLSGAFDLLKDVNLYNQDFKSADYAIKTIDDNYKDYDGYSYIQRQLSLKRKNLKYTCNIDKCN